MEKEIRNNDAENTTEQTEENVKESEHENKTGNITGNKKVSVKSGDDESPEETSNGRKGKKNKVVVINVPKKKRPLATPSYILRIFIVLSFVVVLFLLTYPFLYAQLYISDDLNITYDVNAAYKKLATQEEIDKAEAELKKAYDGLVEAPKKKSEEEYEEESEPSDEEKETSYDEEDDDTIIRSIDTANYEWTYSIANNVDIKSIAGLIDEARSIERSDYTEKSVNALNKSLLEAQKLLCAKVVISQSALQMMLGGSVSEAFGNYGSAWDSVLHGIFAFALAVIPIVCFFAAAFDRKRHIKHVIIMIGAVLALVDIFLTIYPYIGIGAVLSVIMYLFIGVLNIASIYALQQERYIISHPEMEPEYTEKHPQFVKALFNAKSFGALKMPTAREKEYKAAKNAKKRNSKKKKSK